ARRVNHVEERIALGFEDVLEQRADGVPRNVHELEVLPGRGQLLFGIAVVLEAEGDVVVFGWPLVLLVFLVLFLVPDGLDAARSGLPHHVTTAPRDGPRDQRNQQPGEREPEFEPAHSSIRCEGWAAGEAAGGGHQEFCHFAKLPTRRIRGPSYTP